MACVRSDELIAQPACYWVTESHQDAPPAETPTASELHQREETATNKTLTNVRELSILHRVADNTSSAVQGCAQTCVRIARGEMHWHRMQRLPFA
jgi:hypothetical protein